MKRACLASALGVRSGFRRITHYLFEDSKSIHRMDLVFRRSSVNMFRVDSPGNFGEGLALAYREEIVARRIIRPNRRIKLPDTHSKETPAP